MSSKLVFARAGVAFHSPALNCLELTRTMNRIIKGDALTEIKKLPAESINCVMTSPPYWALRDYGIKEQLGLEPTFQEYITKLCDIFDEVKRVLKKDGTCWVNMGDTYYGGGNNRGNTKTLSKIQKGNRGAQGQVQMKWDKSFPQKSLCNIPARFSIEMQNRGWLLRNVIIWHKPNCMPSSVKDRFTIDFEYLFFFTKNKKYWFETQFEQWKDKRPADIQRALSGSPEYNGKYKNNPELANSSAMNTSHCVGNPLKGRNKRAVWTINTKPFREAHFATYPEELCYTPIKAGCPKGGVVLDPFFGAGTTGLVALKQKKKFIGIELNERYIDIAIERLKPCFFTT